MHRYLIAATLVAGLSCALPAGAQSAAEDEARIEELIRREQRAAPASESDVSKTVHTPAAAAGDPAGLAATTAASGPAPDGSVADAAPAGALVTIETVSDAPPEPTIFGDDVMPRDPKAIALADLGAHVGKPVRVRSHGGRARVGRIESVGEAGLTLTTPMGGGYAKYTLPYSQITRIERL